METSIRGKLFMPFRFAAKAREMVPNAFGKEDVLYLVDDEGDVHYFQYLGKNLMRMTEEDAD